MSNTHKDNILTNIYGKTIINNFRKYFPNELIYIILFDMDKNIYLYQEHINYINNMFISINISPFRSFQIAHCIRLYPRRRNFM